jgi:hypothetical protein
MRKPRFRLIDNGFGTSAMAQEYKPGEIVPQSRVYTIAHDPVHADMPHEVTASPVTTATASPVNNATANKGPAFSDLPALQGHHLRAYPRGQARQRIGTGLFRPV